MIRYLRPAIGFILALAIGTFAAVQHANAEGQARVYGTLTDNNGKPLVKVKVFFEAVDIEKRVGPVKTNKKGKFYMTTLDITVAKKWRVVPDLPGYKTVKVSYEIVDSQRNERGKDVLLLGSKQEFPALPFALVGDEGRNVVDMMLAKDADFIQVVRDERRKRSGGTDEAAKAATEVASTPEVKPAPKGSKSVLKQAKSHADAGRHAEAIPLYQQFLAKDPSGNPPAYYYLGKSLVKEGRDTEAEQAFRKGLELKPDMKGAHFFLGDMYLREERYTEAVAELEAEREMNPDSDTVLLSLGVALLNDGRSDEALAVLEQAALINPAKSDPSMYMASIYEKRAGDAGSDSVSRQEHMEKAEEMYQRVVAIDPRNASISFYNIGVRSWNQNRNREAAQAFKKAIEIDPTYADAHRELARALMGVQDFKGAVEHFEEYLKLNPQAADAGEIKSNINLLKS